MLALAFGIASNTVRYCSSSWIGSCVCFSSNRGMTWVAPHFVHSYFVSLKLEYWASHEWSQGVVTLLTFLSRWIRISMDSTFIKSFLSLADQRHIENVKRILYLNNHDSLRDWWFCTYSSQVLNITSLYLPLLVWIAGMAERLGDRMQTGSRRFEPSS